MRKPNAKGKMALLIVGGLVMLVVGFAGGQLVKGLNTLPGDADDPVATQSYVETTVGERLATLTTRIEELEAELTSLKGNATTTNNGTTTTTPATSTTNTNSTTTNTSTTLTITGNTLNVRSGPGTNYEVVTGLTKGDKVTKLGQEGDWYRIQTSGGQTGYISAQYAQ